MYLREKIDGQLTVSEAMDKVVRAFRIIAIYTTEKPWRWREKTGGTSRHIKRVLAKVDPAWARGPNREHVELCPAYKSVCIKMQCRICGHRAGRECVERRLETFEQ